MKNRITFAEFTNLGGRRVNEDSIATVVAMDKYGFVLCDGLGGHGLGDVASQKVVETFMTTFLQSDKCNDILKNTFEIGQKKLIEEQDALGVKDKIKTTAVGVLIDDKKVYIGHVGDSRVYIFKNNKIKCRTLDHSIPQMLVLSKEISEKDIRNHPERNMLLRVMGTEWREPQYELMKPIAVRKCDAILLCSDGFWELIDEDKMNELLYLSKSVDKWLAKMVDEVKRNGDANTMDNYSAIAVWVNKE